MQSPKKIINMCRHLEHSPQLSTLNFHYLFILLTVLFNQAYIFISSVFNICDIYLFLLSVCGW